MSELEHRSTEPINRDRPSSAPGGCECMECGCTFIGDESHQFCAVCVENVAERLWQAQQGEPTYRGREYASAVAEEQARIQRELKR